MKAHLQTGIQAYLGHSLDSSHLMGLHHWRRRDALDAAEQAMSKAANNLPLEQSLVAVLVAAIAAAIAASHLDNPA
jgi:hypothetical protein